MALLLVEIVTKLPNMETVGKLMQLQQSSLQQEANILVMEQLKAAVTQLETAADQHPLELTVE